MLVTLALPVELEQNHYSARVAIFDRNRCELAAASFVVKRFGRMSILLTNTGPEGLAVLFQTWLETKGLSHMLPTDNAFFIDKHVAVTIHLEVVEE